MTTDIWLNQFAGLSQLDEPTKAILLNHSAVLNVPADTVLFGPQKSPENMLFLLEGTVRVQQTAESGHEIVLYRIHAGESCVLTTACLLAYEDYSALGIAETDLHAVAIPRPVFDNLVSRSTTFRDFVFKAFSKRITDLFLMVNEVAFQRIDVRLAHSLLALAEVAGNRRSSITVTHQQLSVELGTAREVISRQLQAFQRHHWITQTRGAIVLIDIDALSKLAYERH